MLYGFGSGLLWATPSTDAFGATIANPTPVLFGALQDVSIDFSFDAKMLSGQNQFPIVVGRGKGKISGKAKFGQLSGGLIASLFFGQAATSSALVDAYDTTGSVIPSTPYTLTPTVPNTGTWAADLGVRDSNGVNMVRVATTPATGQYSVSAGAYTFAAVDTGKTVFIDFQYSASTPTSAKKMIINNVVMGNAPTFRADFANNYQGKFSTVSLYSCISNKLSLATKNDDFLIPEFDFDAFANPAGQIGALSLAE